MFKILIVDDDQLVVDALAQTMEAWGYVAFKCTNGRRALDVLEDNPDFNLIIVDIAMPEMDGRTLIRKIIQQPELESLPIIITSGVEGLGEIRDLLDLGASYFLGKPVSMGELKRYTDKLLGVNREETSSA